MFDIFLDLFIVLVNKSIVFSLAYAVLLFYLECEENPTSYRHVAGQVRSVLITFLGCCGCSFTMQGLLFVLRLFPIGAYCVGTD